MAVKYYYKNMPLSDYCKNNGLNYKNVVTAICKKKKKPKYQEFTDEVLIDLVIKNIGTGVKYYYNGMSLRKYCSSADIKYETIKGRIDNLRANNPELSDNELVVKALEEFKNPKCEYYYQGKSLYEYCKENKELNYHTTRNYLASELEKNPALTIDEIMDTYLKIEHKSRSNYYYCGIPLTKYCKKHKLSYSNIIKFISRNKKEDILPDGTLDEYIEKIMDMYHPFELKYTYKGESLRQYCLKNDIKYGSIKTYIRRKLEINPNRDIKRLIAEALENVHEFGIIYYYQEIPLKDYCAANDLNFVSIRDRCIRLKKGNSLPLQKIVDYCVENYHKAEVKYFYQGESLSSFCEKNNLNYSTIMSAYERRMCHNSEQDATEVLNEVVAYYLENPPLKTKYFVSLDKGESLRQFCLKNSYSYQAVLKRINNFQKDNDNQFDEAYIEMAIKAYEEKFAKEKISNCLRRLDKMKSISFDELTEVCKILNISYDKIVDLVRMDFTIIQAIKIIWFFGNQVDSNNDLIITDSKILDLFELIDNVKHADGYELKKFSLFDLVKLYKCSLFDTRTAILIKQETMFNTILNKVFTNYKVNLNEKNYRLVDSELKTYFIKMIEQSSLNNYKQFKKYMYLSLGGFLKTNIKKWQSELKNPEVDNSENINLDIESLTNNLTSEQQDFIILKFQENLSDEELAVYFNTSIDEIIKMESVILANLLNIDANLGPVIKKDFNG